MCNYFHVTSVFGQLAASRRVSRAGREGGWYDFHSTGEEEEEEEEEVAAALACFYIRMEEEDEGAEAGCAAPLPSDEQQVEWSGVCEGQRHKR